MAELNDKLISYGNLSTFYDKLQEQGLGGNTIEDITYSELKSLRDNSGLTAGQLYRITDYVTRTAQEGTISDEHQFDIIVTADDVNKLNENAMAIQHVFDMSGATTYHKWMYDTTGDAWVLSNEDSYTNEVSGTCPLENTPMYGKEYYTNVYPIEGVIDVNEEEPYMPQVHRKAIILTDGNTLYLGDYINEDRWNDWIDGGEVEGEYPEWFIGKYFLDNGDTYSYDGTYTEGVDNHFANSKLESWELKYCLDNDTNRFSWAKNIEDASSFKVLNGSEYVEGGKDYVLTDVKISDIHYGEDILDDFPNAKYVWSANDAGYYSYAITSTKSLKEDDAVLYCESNGDSRNWGTADSIVYQSGTEGKGVIYYMKDEWNNQVYFDFKNIRIWDEENDDYSYLFGRDDGDYTLDGNDYNNIINSYIEHGIMQIDTELLFYFVRNYQNVYNEGNGIKIENQTISISDNLSDTLSYITYMINVLENPNDYVRQYFTLEAAADNCEITFPSYWYIEISRDLLNWEIPQDSIIATLNNGEKLYIRSNTGVVDPSYRNSPISFSEPCYAYGNIISLIYGKNFNSTQDKKLVNYAFYRTFKNNINLLSHSNKKMIIGANTVGQQACREMFYGCTNLTTAPELPATTVANNCYESMFQGCTNLTTAPSILPATTLANECYGSMFFHCKSLTTAPELPATTLAYQCYNNMFDDCTSLTTAPSILPATTLAEGCYRGMFGSCTKLTTAPELPATTLANNCYESMFMACSGLTSVPELPATTLANKCYYQMFTGCKNLTIAPELPATTLANNCYESIFYGCSRLNYIKCLAVNGINQNNSTYEWVNSVASTGTFVKSPDATSWTRDKNGIPTGWTVENA